ncbi:coenzyme A pyrophosphatase [Vibrio sp. UCD-FRSSP16_10]|uniref:CoA pyrophosphatase n=1 Tax=unclassified Vibrio TaxID=2614977 RepID=UPI0007FFD119|nr:MULTISPECIES: CoA pyrophosphatase [unclassified Vibrio]OBT13162.1 coenzyme A pyrophosphatase [Vibrio sp. UCD-FRSSP16_30]OBT19563.1 coenzyme A pyrophosphatase [Vibrio sp. UCD-FRSSP16_10]
MTKNEFILAFTAVEPFDYDSLSLQRLGFIDQSQLRPAAVLIGLVERNNSLYVVLTKRAAHLKHHPGQVSFPGGKFEQSDEQLSLTAIRETHEEVGIEPSMINIIGALPAIPTISRFAVTPFIAMIDANYQSKIDPNEVAEVFEVPAQFLFSSANLFHFHFELKTVTHKVFAIPYRQHFIWGVTAQIIDAVQRQLSHFGRINSA